jgi:hypothetical protein
MLQGVHSDASGNSTDFAKLIADDPEKWARLATFGGAMANRFRCSDM